MTKAQDAHALVSYFVKKYELHYGKTPNINRYTAKWGFEAMLGGMKKSEAQDLVDYYFTAESHTSHSVEWLLYNYEKVSENKTNAEINRSRMDSLREQTRLRAEEWRKTHKTL